MIGILDGQIEFIFMPVRGAAVLRAPIGQEVGYGYLVLLEEREYAVIEEVRRVLRSYSFATPTLR
jgi:hypothetical protein